MRLLTLLLAAGLMLTACADAPQDPEDTAQTMAQQKAEEARARLSANEGGQ